MEVPRVPHNYLARLHHGSPRACHLTSPLPLLPSGDGLVGVDEYRLDCISRSAFVSVKEIDDAYNKLCNVSIEVYEINEMENKSTCSVICRIEDRSSHHRGVTHTPTCSVKKRGRERPLQRTYSRA